MAGEDETRDRSREALTPFLAAALRARAPAELAGGGSDETVTLSVSVSDVRRALAIYEKDLNGDRLVDWIAEGRAARAQDNGPGSRRAYVLEVVPSGGGDVSSYDCDDLDEVRKRIEVAASSAAGSMQAFLGEAAPPEQLAAQLGRQAFRRLSAQVRSHPATTARFDLPDRPWLRLSVARIRSPEG